jgi:uncharacterized coiled-coil protein SlyX
VERTENRNHNNNSKIDYLKVATLALSLLTMAVSIGLLWGTMEQRVSGIEDRIDRQQQEIQELKVVVNDFDVSLTQIKVQLAGIETDLTYVRTWIERQEEAR